jgi:hypothetical protein
MKNLRQILIYLLLLSVTLPVFSQNAERTLVKSFMLAGTNAVQLDIDGEWTVQTWAQDNVRIQLQVTLENANETNLNSLIMSRRYDLKSRIENDELVIFAPGLQYKPTISGRTYKEKISILVSAPERILVNQKEREARIGFGNMMPGQ